MDQETIRKIAEEVGHYLPDYRWVLIAQVVITALGAGIAAYVGSFLKTRGQNFATKADFGMLLDQLSVQTKAVETIKSEISQKDWAAREWANLRRLKLEELLNKVAECEGYLERLRRATFEGIILADHRDYGTELSSLATLYFKREMIKEVGAYLTIYRGVTVAITGLGVAYMEAGTDPSARAAAVAKFKSKYAELFPESLKARSALDNAAQKLMLEIMDVAK
jgi:hypothetical protein